MKYLREEYEACGNMKRMQEEWYKDHSGGMV